MGDGTEMRMADRARFPALDHAAAIRSAFAGGVPFVLLQAGTGSGKSTALVRELARDFTGGVVLLEPRRLAARMVASYIDEHLSGDAPGASRTPFSLAGYLTRFDSRVTGQTKIISMTGGVFVNRLLADPFLSDAGLVVLDEFHERNLDSDFALAMLVGLVREFRPDLRVLILSATIDGERIRRHLDDRLGAGRCRVFGATDANGNDGARRYKLDIRYPDYNALRDPVTATAGAIRLALRESAGDMLVFLPGAREIRGVARLISVASGIVVHVLHGDLDPERQRAALRPDAHGLRRVILSTPIAESSLTIDGISVVIDSGLENVPYVDAGRGLTRLVTVPITLESAAQRAGRAARTADGIAWRLWTRADERGFRLHAEPEILAADLAPLVLRLKAAGLELPPDGDWLDAPPAPLVTRANALLANLDALDGNMKITARGQRMAREPLHPRLARMLDDAAGDRQDHATACILAALLEERDIYGPERRQETDLSARIALVAGFAESGRVEEGQLKRVRHIAAMLARRNRTRLADAVPDRAGLILARAWPERIAMKSETNWNLAGGGSVAIPAGPAAFLVIPDIDAQQTPYRARLSAVLSADDFAALFPLLDAGAAGPAAASGSACRARLTVDCVVLDAAGRPRAVREIRFGALVLERKERQVTGEAGRAELYAAGLEGMAGEIMSEAARQLLARLEFVRKNCPDCHAPLPELDAVAIVRCATGLATKELAACRSLEEAAAIDWALVVRRRLGREALAEMDRLAPAELALPVGIKTKIDYDRESGPTASARLQQFFGLRNHPRVAGDRIPVALELLSPGGRPVQLTRDIASFWNGSYRDVRKELRGRYPKHDWPEDPASARPSVRGTKPRPPTA